jgi:hemerythrin
MSETVLESRSMAQERIFTFEGEALEAAIAAWSANSEAQQDPQQNRQLLAQVAIYLVQEFRAEEARLSRVKSPQLRARRTENQHLARQLWSLMAGAEQGIDVAPGLQGLAKAWRGRGEGGRPGSTR